MRQSRLLVVLLFVLSVYAILVYQSRGTPAPGITDQWAEH